MAVTALPESQITSTHTNPGGPPCQSLPLSCFSGKLSAHSQRWAFTLRVVYEQSSLAILPKATRGPSLQLIGGLLK